MGIGSITIPSSGSATAPQALKLTLPTVDPYRSSDHGPMSLIDLPTILGVLWGCGHDQLRHIVTNVLKTGILAPEVGPTVTPSGSRGVWTFTGTPGPIDEDLSGERVAYHMNPAPSARSNIIVAVGKGTLPTTPSTTAFVLKGSTDADTCENFRKFVNQTGIDGGDYTLPRNPSTGAVLTETLPNNWFEAGGTGTTVTLTHKRYGMLDAGVRWTYVTAPATTFTLAKTTSAVPMTGIYPEAGLLSYAYAYFRTEDVAFSGLSPYTEVDLEGGGQIGLSAMESPDDPDDDVDWTRVLRTGPGGDVYHRNQDVDEDAGVATDALDLDTLLTRATFDWTLYPLFEGGYPPRGRCLALYKGAVHTAGARIAADYSAGTASVTNGDNEVVLTGGFPTVEWIGREFRVDGDSLLYPISRVDSASKKLYLATDYEGSTDGAAGYVVKDTRNPYELFRAEPELPNAWPGHSVRGILSQSSVGVTALVTAYGSLVGFTQTGLWRITSGDTGTIPQLHHESEKAGCVGPRAALMVEGALWWLASDGIFVWPGGGPPMNMTAPPVEGGEVRGIHGTIDRLNERQLDQTVSCYSRSERVIRWLVALDDDVTARHMIVLDLNVMAFEVDECPDFTEVAEVVDAGGVKHVLAGDIHGNIFELGVGENDGAFGFETVQDIQSTDHGSVTVAGTPFPTTGDGLVGVPVYLATTSGEFYRMKIRANDNNRLYFTEHSVDVASSLGQIVVGGIRWDLESGRWHAGDLRNRKGLHKATIGYVQQARGRVWFCSAIDDETPMLFGGDTEVDLMGPKGRWVVSVNQNGYLHKQRIVSIVSNFTPKIHALEYEVELESRP